MKRMTSFYQPIETAAGFPWGCGWYTTMDEKYQRFFLHWHKELEILKLSGGRGNFVLNFQDYEVKDGDIVLISPQMFHAGSVMPGDSLVCGLVSINPDLISSPSEQLMYQSYVQPFEEERLIFTPVISSAEYPEIAQQIDDVIQLFQTRGEAALLLKAELIKLYAMLIDNGLFSKQNPNHLKDPGNMKEVLQYIDQNLANKIVPEELAKLAGYSKYHFIRKFKEQTGTTVIHYINSRRVSAAADLLVTTQLPIGLIAEKCGIPTTPYFIKLFREEFSMSPLEFRKFYRQ